MRTVVVVDDEPITRMDLRDMLEEVGFEVVAEASDGFDGVEACRAKRPDIVLMDVKMPIFDGISAAEVILEENLAGCVVLLTAFCDREIVERAEKVGVTGYLVKPVEKKSLLPTISVAFAQSEKLRETNQRAEAAEQRIQEERMIQRAKRILMKQENCTDVEAYNRIRTAAMNKRITIPELAQRVVQQAQRGDNLAKAKALLMQRGMSEERAYHTVEQYAAGHNCTMEEAASAIQKEMGRRK